MLIAAHRIFDAANGRFEADIANRGVEFSSAEGRKVTIPLVRYRDFEFAWSQPCAQCAPGRMNRLAITDKALELGCTHCRRDPIRYYSSSVANEAKRATRR